MKKERRKYLDLISKNLSVCSNKTIDEVLNSLKSDERNYVSELIEKIRNDGTDNN
jgi:predicted lactoylglutathione lyase